MRDLDRLKCIQAVVDGDLKPIRAAGALAEIGDKRAVGPLINALRNKDPSIRVLVIYALERMKAPDALPALHALLSDDAHSTFGSLLSVADAARNAIAKLEAH